MTHLLRAALAVVVVVGFARIVGYCAAPEAYADEQTVLKLNAAENARAVEWRQEAGRLAEEGVPLTPYADEVREALARGEAPSEIARRVREQNARYAAVAMD